MLRLMGVAGDAARTAARSRCAARRSSTATTELLDRHRPRARSGSPTSPRRSASARRWSSTTSAPRTRCVAEAFAHAVERDLDRLDQATAQRHRPAGPAAPGAAALRPHRARRPAGGCGSTPGRWRSASRRSARCCAGWTSAGAPCCARWSSDGVAEGVFTCADPAALGGPASPRCSTACRSPRSSTAAVTRAPAARLGAPAAVAHELGLDRRCDPPADGHLTPASAPGSRVGQRRAGPAGTARDVGRRTPVDGQVGQQPAERRRELEPVRGAQPHHAPTRGPGTGDEHEVAVGGQGVLAAHRAHRRADCRAACRACARRSRPASSGSGSQVRSSRVDDRPAAVLRRLDRRLAVATGSRRTTGRPSRSTAAAVRARSRRAGRGRK